MNLAEEFKKGIVKENPIFRMALGMCPTLAVSTTVANALGMGLASTAVLLCSNAVVSLVRTFVPERVRIPIYIVIIASFVTITGMIMEAFFYALYKSLGIFLPLIVVNCVILGRAEGYASKNSLVPSLVDAVGMGIGFTLALFILASIRELFGSGTILGVNVFGSSYKPVLIMILPPGAFIALGFLMGIMNKLQRTES